MKLFLCRNCQDVLKLDYKPRTCKCGESGGKYLEDGIHAEYWGDCVMLGFANSKLTMAVNNQPERGMGKEFTAFVIPRICPTAKRVEK